jgi:hypothetical protein
MKKCVYTIAVDNWFPEICQITFPLIKAWSKKIGADFRIISETKLKSWPPNHQKFQIFELGKDYDWNIYLDADMIVDPIKMPDFTEYADPTFIYYESFLYPRDRYRMHPYFIRDGRNLGISDCFFISSSFTHDLWFPNFFTFDEARTFCLGEEREVSEFALNLNIARFGLKLASKMGYDKNHFHLQTTDDHNRIFNGGPKFLTKEEHVARALEKINDMGIQNVE